MKPKKHINRIVSVSALEDRRLEVSWQGGQTVIVNCSELVERLAVFEPLKDRDFFNRVQVADWGHSLEWPNGEGLDADRVMEMALEQAGRGDVLDFRHWQEKHGLSLAQAASELGLSRRTVSQYRTGCRKVPRTVLLALKGWEVSKASSAC